MSELKGKGRGYYKELIVAERPGVRFILVGVLMANP
jgi:hypothetical protein